MKKTGHANLGISVIIAPNPVNELKKYLKKEEYLTALALAVQDFQHYGMHALRRYLKAKKIQIDVDARVRTPHQLIVLLRVCEIVTQEIYDKMLEVNNFRGNKMHKLGERITMDKVEAKNIIEKAIECIEFLLSTK